jgi:hypothetical protein
LSRLKGLKGSIVGHLGGIDGDLGSSECGEGFASCGEGELDVVHDLTIPFSTVTFHIIRPNRSDKTADKNRGQAPEQHFCRQTWEQASKQNEDGGRGRN